MKRSLIAIVGVSICDAPASATRVEQAYMTLDNGDRSEQIIWASPPQVPASRTAEDARRSGKFSVISCDDISSHGKPKNCRPVRWSAADREVDMIAKRLVQRARVSAQQARAFRVQYGTGILVTIRFGPSIGEIKPGASCPPTLCRIEPGQ